MTRELVSIIIPTHNRPVELQRAINSALQQTYEHIEIIVSDDNHPGSEYAKRNKKIVDKIKATSTFEIKYTCLEYKKNASAARNAAFKIAKGIYIALLDDDDEFHAQRIEKLLPHLSNAASYYGAVYSAFSVNNSDNVIESNFKSGNFHYESLMGISFVGSGSNLFFKKEILQYGNFNEKYSRHQDIEFLIRFFRRYDILYYPEPLLTIHQYTGVKRHLPIKMLEQAKQYILSDFKNDICGYTKSKRNSIYGRQYYELALMSVERNKYLRFLKYLITSMFYKPLIIRPKTLIKSFFKGMYKK